jgi:ribonuclease HI
VIIDPESGKIVERLKKFLGDQTNNVAEYEGVLLGLRRAQELGIREVEVIADSQLVIRQLGGQYRVKNMGLKPLYDAAVRLLKTFDRVRLVHVPRELNTEADEMSNRAIDEK